MPRFDNTFGSPPSASYAAARRRSSRSAMQSRSTSAMPVMDDDEEDVAKAGVWSSVANLINNIVGAGLLSMAWCLKEGTLLPGVAALMVMCAFNVYSFILLARCCEYAGTFSYKEMGHQALGVTWGYIIQGAMAFYTTGSCISYVVLTGDFLSGASGVVSYWLPGSFLTSRVVVVAIMTVVVIVPLSMFKSLDKLRHTSTLSFFGIVFSLVVVIVEYFRRKSEGLTHDEDVIVAKPTLGLFAAIPILNVAFCAAYNGPRYYQELKDRSMGKFTLVVCLSLGFCFVVYGLMAVAGYFTFGVHTNSDVLTNYGPRLTIVLITRFVLTFIVIFTYPLSFHALRLSVLTLLSATAIPRSVQRSTWFYATVVTLLIGITVGTGAFVDNVGIVLDYKGAIFGSSIIYIFPGLMFIQLKRQAEGFASLDSSAPLLGPQRGDDCSATATSIASSNVSRDAFRSTHAQSTAGAAAHPIPGHYSAAPSSPDGRASQYGLSYQSAGAMMTREPRSSSSVGAPYQRTDTIGTAHALDMGSVAPERGTVNGVDSSMAGTAGDGVVPGRAVSQASNIISVDARDVVPLSPLWQWSHVPAFVLIAGGFVFMVMGTVITSLKVAGTIPRD